MKIDTDWNYVRFFSECEVENTLLRELCISIEKECEVDLVISKEFYELIIQTYY